MASSYKRFNSTSDLPVFFYMLGFDAKFPKNGLESFQNFSKKTLKFFKKFFEKFQKFLKILEGTTCFSLVSDCELVDGSLESAIFDTNRDGNYS